MWSKLARLEQSLKSAAVCTVVSISGSTPRKVGAKMIVIDNGNDHGQIEGSIGGGAIEHWVRLNAIKAIQRNAPKLLTTSLRNELGMCCGGEMVVFIEPIAKTPQFFCFGAGHIAQSLCPLMINLGFLTTVVDERKDLLAHENFSLAQKVFDTSSFAIKELRLDDAFVVVTTHDHALDQQIVEEILPKKFKFAALVGSQRKALMTKKRLLAKGFSPTEIERILCPAGIDIKAQTPLEIALSIASQMVLIKNG